MQRVEFYVNGFLVNTDTAGPFSFNVSGLGNGTYTLTAKAVDQLNAETISAPITVTVGAAPLQGYFIDTDHLNTPRLITDSTGTAVWRNDNTEPFGNTPPDENPSGMGAFEFSLRFPGQYFDKESNLAYNYFRDYDPSVGRYVESDPIGLKGGLNTFAYVRGRPVERIDPMGLIDDDEVPPNNDGPMNMGRNCFLSCMAVTTYMCIQNPGYGLAMCAACLLLRSPPAVAACLGMCARNSTAVCISVATAGCTAACAIADYCFRQKR